MRRASTLAAAALAATGALALADAASAQSGPAAPPTAGQAQGLRYLTWQGHAEPTPASREVARPASARGDLRRPNTVIPHGGFANAEAPQPQRLAPGPTPPRRTLTPANAWLRPAPAAPAAAAPPVTAPSVVRETAPPPPPPPGPEYLPDQGRRAQPAPAEAVYPAPAPREAASAAADPMAPRRDAPIFRMQQQTAPPAPIAATPADAPQASPRAEASASPPRVVEVVNSGEAPPRQGGRYYSVHRQNGREPDALTMPAPTYVDALVVSSIDTMASQDLAEPEPGPTLIRDRNGSMRPVPASSDGDHQ